MLSRWNLSCNIDWTFPTESKSPGFPNTKTRPPLVSLVKDRQPSARYVPKSQARSSSSSMPSSTALILGFFTNPLFNRLYSSGVYLSKSRERFSLDSKVVLKVISKSPSRSSDTSFGTRFPCSSTIITEWFRLVLISPPS